MIQRTKIGTAGQFIYDLNCIRDARSRNFDIIYQLGYTSSSIWGWFLPQSSIIVTNMDGLEWKRSKYSPKIQKFLKTAEKWAINSSDQLISDSKGIQSYIKKEYDTNSLFIPYASNIFSDPNRETLNEYNLEGEYNMIVARLEPENSIEKILDGQRDSNNKLELIIIGNHETDFGHYLKNKYKDVTSIRFLGGIYNQKKLSDLRFYSNIYFHGHTVGGTNPSLIEAMGNSCFICHHDNVFNNAIVGNDGVKFKNSSDIQRLLDEGVKKADFKEQIENNLTKVKSTYSIQSIVDQHHELFQSLLKK